MLLPRLASSEFLGRVSLIFINNVRVADDISVAIKSETGFSPRCVQTSERHRCVPKQCSYQCHVYAVIAFLEADFQRKKFF